MVETARRNMEQARVAHEVSDRERALQKLRTLMDGAEQESIQLQAAVWLGKSAALFTDVVQQTTELSADQIRQRLDELANKARTLN